MLQGLYCAHHFSAIQRIVYTLKQLINRLPGLCRATPMLTVNRGKPGIVMRATAARIDSAICNAVSSEVCGSRMTNSSPPAEHHVVLPTTGFQRSGEGNKHLIALQMAKQVVDVLK